MTTELIVKESSIENHSSGFDMRPRTMDEAMKYCDLMANSTLVPNTYKGKPGDILVAIQMGAELGLTPIRSLRCIAVINGRASMWGDELLAMVLNSPLCEYVNEDDSTETEGICKVKRKGSIEHVSTFTIADAKRAGLLGKAGTWQTHTKRMLTLRARGFALRDKFADVLAGLITTEEALDIPADEPEPKLKVELPPSLKDKLKAKVEAVEQRQEDGGDVVTDHLRAQQGPDAPAPSNIFTESSAIADHETMLDECKTEDELKAAWEECTKDKRLTSETRKPLYDRFMRLANALKAKK